MSIQTGQVVAGKQKPMADAIVPKLIDPNEVFKLNGPVLVLAGPGTGKTVSIARRAKWLVEEQKVSPKRIVVITFTKEAEASFRAKIGDTSIQDQDNKPLTYIEPGNYPEHISTMHALAWRIAGCAGKLNQECSLLQDAKIISCIYRDAAIRLGYSQKEAELSFDYKKTADLRLNDNPYCLIEQEYQRIMKLCNRISQDDSIRMACDVLDNNKSREVVTTNLFGGEVEALIIDEYQDIDNNQLKLIKLLSKAHPRGVYAVGDDEQSIYSFRGGSSNFIKKFPEDLGGHAQIVTINVCRRFSQKLAKAARIFLQQFFVSPIRKHEPVFVDPQDTKIFRKDFPTDKGEVIEIASICSDKLGNTDKIYVLVPSKNYLYPLADALAMRGIALIYQESAKCAGILNLQYINQLTNKGNNANVRACLELILDSQYVQSSKKVNKSTLQLAIAKLWDDVISDKSLYEVIRQKAGADYNIKLFWDSLSVIRGPGRAEIKSLKDLRKLFYRFKVWPTSLSLLRDVDLVAHHIEKKYLVSPDKVVRVTTIHSSKGLDGDVVFIVGLSDGIFPTSEKGKGDNKDGNKEGRDLSEYARLMYVAMTRAKRELYIFRPRRVIKSGAGYQSSERELDPSPFFTAIPDDCIDKLSRTTG